MHHSLVVNKGMENEIDIEYSPVVHFAQAGNLPSNPIIPFVRLDE
jgi:hypothetical protein